MIATWITVGIIVLILAGAIAKIVRDKKKGVQCVGCPGGHDCTHDKHMP